VAVHSYLFQYELPDTALVFTKAKIFVFSGPKKIELMRDMMGQEGYECAQTLELLQRTKEGNDAHMQTISTGIKESFNGQVVGILDDESSGATVDLLAGVLDSLQRVSVVKQVSNMLAVKDDQELRCIQTAASIASAVMKNSFVTKMEEIVDGGKKVHQEELAAFVEGLFAEPHKISSRLNPNVVDAPFRPSVQSGGQYDLESWPPAFDESHSERDLHFRCIVLQLGARYKSYTAVVGRTYLVDPTKYMQEAYTFLEGIYKKVLGIMYPGTECEHIYKAALDWIKENEKFKGLAANFSAEIGAGVGLELAEAEFAMKPGNKTKLKANMTMVLRMGFSNIPVPEDAKDKRAKKDANARTFCVYLCDTVRIQDQEPEVLTNNVRKATSDVFYFLEDEADEKDKKKKEAPKKPVAAPKKPAAAPVKKEKREEPKAKAPKKEEESDYDEDDEGGDVKVRSRGEVESSIGRRQRTTRALDHQAASEAKESKRKTKQRQLFEKLREEALSLLDGNEGSDSAAAKAKIKEYIAYKSPADFPDESTKTTIFVDQLRQAVLLPMHGMIVPFHISTIKSVSMTDSDLRIVFKAPDALIAKQQNPAYVKEAQFRLKNVEMLSTAFRSIESLKKSATKFEKEAALKADLVEQEKLRLSSTPGPRLPNVSIRPTLGGGRHVTGTLEAHDNGFRYTTTKKATVEVMYNNIQHAFFQAADPSALIVLIHFHLKNPILIGKKKTSDVQFFTKVMEASEQVDGRRMGATYQDELEEEQRERQRRNVLNGQFSQFVKKMEAFKPDVLSFDIPFRELGFFGVPSRNRVFLQPTVNCLVSIVEEPFFVLTLDDVEVCYFERVAFGMKQFELVFIKKDYAKPSVPINQTFVTINSVPIEKLDLIKDWLNDINIKYYEGRVSLNWKTVLTKIRDDLRGFWEEEGGWRILDASDSENEDEGEKPAASSSGGGGGGAGGEESEESERDFVPEEDEESDDYSGSDDEGSGYSMASDDDAPDSEDDEAPSWDEMEDEEEEEPGKKRRRDDDSDDDQPKKKRRKE
jgi:nucleosome binding factor SPN SPT16 subunit